MSNCEMQYRLGEKIPPLLFLLILIQALKNVVTNILGRQKSFPIQNIIVIPIMMHGDHKDITSNNDVL